MVECFAIYAVHDINYAFCTCIHEILASQCSTGMSLFISVSSDEFCSFKQCGLTVAKIVAEGSRLSLCCLF